MLIYSLFYDADDRAGLEAVLEDSGETFEEALERAPKWVLRHLRNRFPSPHELSYLIEKSFLDDNGRMQGSYLFQRRSLSKMRRSLHSRSAAYFRTAVYQ